MTTPSLNGPPAWGQASSTAGAFEKDGPIGAQGIEAARGDARHTVTLRRLRSGGASVWVITDHQRINSRPVRAKTGQRALRNAGDFPANRLRHVSCIRAGF